MLLVKLRMKNLWPLMFICLPLVFNVAVKAAAVPIKEMWQPNGPVYAVEIAKGAGADSVFIGGDFTYVGPESGNATAVSTSRPTQGYPVFSNRFLKEGVDGMVFVAVPSGSDGWYVGGDFSAITDSHGTYDRGNLAEINADGEVTDWNPATNGAVHALLFDSANNTLYAGGEFISVNVSVDEAIPPVTADPQTRNYLAAFNTLTDQNNATAWDPAPNGFVYALVHAPAILPTAARLYVGGNFTEIDDVVSTETRNRIARLKINQTAHVVGGYDDDWNPDVNGLVKTLVFDGVDRLFAGGDFTQVNGSAPRNNLAVFDTTNDTNNALGWKPDANDVVLTLALLGNSLYIGGDFSKIGTADWPGFVVSDVSSLDSAIIQNDWGGNRLPFIGADEASVSVRKIIATGGLLYVASNGKLAADTALNRAVSRMSVLNPGTGAVSWSTDTGSGLIYAIAPVGDQVFIAGTFASGGGRIRSNIAELDLNTDATRGVATGWDVFVNGPVHSIASTISGQVIYIGGQFSAVHHTDTLRNNIALLSATSNRVETWNPSITGDANAKVAALALSPDQTTLYAGGWFSQVAGLQGESRNNIAALNTTVAGIDGEGVLNTNSAIGRFDGANGEVYALAVSSDNELLFAGGNFTIIGGDFNSKVAALSVANGTPLSNDDLWAITDVDQAVHTLTLSSDDRVLYIGGEFTSIRTIDKDGVSTDKSRNHIAALKILPFDESNNIDKWNLDTSVNPDVTGTGVYSLGLSTDDQMLWLGGNFSNVASSGEGRNHVARYNLSEPLLTEWNPDVSTGTVVHAIERNTDDSLIIIGGDFSKFGSIPNPVTPQNHLAVFDTTRPTVTNHVAGGFYNTPSLDLILSCTHNSSAGPCEIFYTLDATPTQLTALSEVYVQPPPAPPEPPPPPRVDEVFESAEVKFFAKDAHGTVSEINSVSYGIDGDPPMTTAQPNVILKDILHGDGYTEVSDTGIEIALVCEDSGGANCDRTYYTADGSAPNNEDGTPAANAKLYVLPLTPKQLLPLGSYTLEDLVGDEQDVFRDMTLADIVSSIEQAAIRIDLDAFTLADIPPVAVARNSIDLERVLEHVDLAAIQIDSIPGNILSNVIAAANIPDDAETFADIGAENLDLTQITLGSISGAAYSLADIPASLAPPPTYITASQVPLIQVGLDRSENHIVLDAVRRDMITLEQIPAEFIPGTRLYGFIELRFFSIDRAGNSEANAPGVGVKREIYYVDIGAPETQATPNTGGNVFTSEIHVALECYDYGDEPSGFSELPVGVETAATGSGCREGGTYYTLGGRLPIPSEVGTGGATQRYTGPIPISSASIVRFLSVDELGNEEVSGFEVYTFTLSRVGHSGVGASGWMVLFALSGLLLRWRRVRTALQQCHPQTRDFI